MDYFYSSYQTPAIATVAFATLPLVVAPALRHLALREERETTLEVGPIVVRTKGVAPSGASGGFGFSHEAAGEGPRPSVMEGRG